MVYQSQVVLIAIYPTDYERSRTNFRLFLMPKYLYQVGKLSLENVPAPTPNAELQRIDQAMGGRIYLVERDKNVARKIRLIADAERALFKSTSQMVGPILKRLRN